MPENNNNNICLNNNNICLVNICLKNGKFPSSWRIALIALIPKKGSSKRRSISLLPVFGKFFDKLLCSRLLYYLHKFNKIDEKQYGFTKQKGTREAVFNTVKEIREKGDSNYIAVVSLDIKGAFDCVKHIYIIEQLVKMNVPNNLILCIDEFLKNRVAIIQGITFEIERGCPQGSSAGPVLWDV